MPKLKVGGDFRYNSTQGGGNLERPRVGDFRHLPSRSFSVREAMFQTKNYSDNSILINQLSSGMIKDSWSHYILSQNNTCVDESQIK